MFINATSGISDPERNDVPVAFTSIAASAEMPMMKIMRKEALNVMGRMKFDAVITDLEMPVMHGYDLMSEMKKSPELMNLPVIVLTSRAGDKHRQKALEMGAQDYLVKPFEEQEMLGALKKLLSGAALASRA